MIQQFHFQIYTQNNWKQKHRYLYTDVHNSVIIHKSQKVKATHVSIDIYIRLQKGKKEPKQLEKLSPDCYSGSNTSLKTSQIKTVVHWPIFILGVEEVFPRINQNTGVKHWQVLQNKTLSINTTEVSINKVKLQIGNLKKFLQHI